MSEPIFDQLDAWERSREAWANRRPVCCICGENIQEEYCYELTLPGYALSEPFIICPDCIDSAKVFIEEE